jgi:hypothetical protein
VNKMNSPSKADLIEALKHINDESAEEDAAEDLLISARDGTFIDVIDDDDVTEEIPPIFVLADVPVEKWNDIVLSKASKFGDSKWDFTSFPHVNKKQAIANFDYVNIIGVNLTDPLYAHWERIAKILVFYSIPHFAASNLVRSYGSMSTRKSRFLRLLALFKTKGLYSGEVGSAEFRTINDLSPTIIKNFISELATPALKWEVAHTIRYWQKLSNGRLLPVEYSIFLNCISEQDVAQYRKEYDESCSPYQPIALDDYANIINHCIRSVEDYSRDVIWLYETYYPTVVGGFDDPSRAALKPGGFSPSSLEGVEAFRNYQPIQHEGEPWWPLKILERESPHTSKSKPWGLVSATSILSLIASLLDACCVTILASTGMRRSEVMGLTSGCVERDAEGFWLRYTVFKTSRASQGDKKRIPIPDVTAKAIAIIERICCESRTYGAHNYLFSSINRVHFGKATHAAYPERAVKRVAEAVDADETIHPHRFRKTLAMYLIYQDPTNIEVVRQLFSHASLKMTLRYIMSLPGVNDEMKRIIAEQNVDVLLEVLEGALKGRIGGEAGKRVLHSVENSPQFVARLQDKGKEALIQYVESMLEQGIKILHRTNLAICMKTPGYVEAAPCDGKNENASEKIHPNLFACDPFNCRFAAFVESNIPSLKNEVVFHERLSKHPYSGDAQKRFSKRRIAEATKRLEELGEVGRVAVGLHNG